MLQQPFSTARKSYKLKSAISRGVLFGGTALAAGGGSFYLADDAKHYYEAAERSGRVATTLYACINE